MRGGRRGDDGLEDGDVWKGVVNVRGFIGWNYAL